MKRSTIVEIICYAFFFLFVYTALSKWLIYPLFVDDLHRSPLTGPFAVLISIIIPASELVVAILLLFNKTRKWGLYAVFILMVLFTGYVGYVLGLTKDRPCSCGGIIRNMSWPKHMIFNTILTLLAAIGIWFNHNNEHNSEKNDRLISIS